MKIIIKKVKAGWYFKFVACNGRTLCHSEIYKRKFGCVKGINSIKHAIIDRDFRVEEE